MRIPEMMFLRTRFLLPCAGLVLVVAGFTLLSPPTRACAPVKSADAQVAIAEESAIIIWDEATKTQHFIRRASFQTSAADFGFLVPTPTKPDLAATGDEVFGYLDEITKPKVVTRFIRGETNFAAKGEAPAMAAPGGGVNVVDSQRVGPFDVVILKATDAAALNDWLKKNNYQSSPELVDWFKPYVKAGWMISAFKYAQDARWNPGVTTSATRMSFKTDRPFFPYSEPSKAKNVAPDPQFDFRGRLLRVYFVGDKRMAGVMGETQTPWTANTAWSNTLQAAEWDMVKTDLKMDGLAVPESGWLTIFEDPSSPRAGTADVYFEPSTDQNTVKRPDIINFVHDPDGRLARAAGQEPEGTNVRMAVLVTVAVVVGLLLIGVVVMLLSGSRRRVQ